MKKPLVILLTVLSAVSYSQSTQKLIELGKAYKNFMFMSEPPKDAIKKLSTNMPPELVAANDFIVQTVTTKNDLLQTKFLTLPNASTLKQLYIIRAVNYNVRKEDQIDNNKLVDSLQAKDIPRYELVDAYYDLLFTGVGNKNQPFNLKKVNFTLEDYGLADDTEKGIFFLEAMSLCGSSIWGYINVPKPPNYKLAYEFIGKFPQFNGLEYYEFTDLHFPDFQMVLDESKGKESYKAYYLNKYYETLLYHLICLKNGIGPEKDINKVMIGSILKDESLYKYSENKGILDDLFESRKR
jgi:hypothetical protein